MAEMPKETYPFFTLSNANQLGSGFGFGFFDQPSKPTEPLPPPTEVIPSEEKSPADSNADPIEIASGLTLLKGKVSTFDVFGVSNSDLVPGKYEGGLKLWEGSIDLVKALHFEVQESRLMIKGKRVLELGCGHGLPGIFTLIEGATTVHFQDFNAEVLKFLTIPNVKANLEQVSNKTEANISSDVRYFSGDWSEVHKLLLPKCSNEQQNTLDNSSSDGYDVILMAETVYELSSLQSLYDLIKKCLLRPSGVVYVAGKKHYFGVGGGTRQFLLVVEEDGVMESHLVAEVADGSSNVREVWKFSYKEA
ncbi:histidine protein methyltransferase 1 homolog [Asparagus officinalis]|uniref:histidine protein methyltransferase 1 homolog n=1 Tax=Asparagus officinalis TaxID=4686 RepID=UPI00098E4BEC|nr:histidine protein methyltransferase 1 homolog [Asparagus officinalis]XP_020242022.1 histidine protein methyltransferase 1 homolog [Asparagus officinalis]